MSALTWCVEDTRSRRRGCQQIRTESGQIDPYAADMSASRRSRRPTLADVAQVVGVSAKSVSRVVHDDPRVSQELRTAVQAAIKTLGYRPDRRASTLASGPGSQLIGYVQAIVGNPFFAGVFRGLDDAVRESGYTVVSGYTDAESQREHDLIDALLGLRVDGLVIAGTVGDDELIRSEVKAGTSIVCVDRIAQGLICDTVVSDNRAGVEQAVGHLWDQGHRRIAFLGGVQGLWVADERLAGFHEAVAARHGRVDSDLIVADLWDGEAAEKAARRLLTARTPTPTAIVTAGAEFTDGAIRAMQTLDLADSIALIGFDEVDHAEQLQPAVAVVAQDPYQMGRAAGELLLDRLVDPDRPTQRTVVPCDFISRASAWIPATA